MIKKGRKAGRWTTYYEDPSGVETRLGRGSTYRDAKWWADAFVTHPAYQP